MWRLMITFVAVVDVAVVVVYQAIDGNGMTVRAWFEVMDQMTSRGRITHDELARGMRMLELHSKGRKKQRVLSPEKVQ